MSKTNRSVCAGLVGVESGGDAVLRGAAGAREGRGRERAGGPAGDVVVVGREQAHARVRRARDRRRRAQVHVHAAPVGRVRVEVLARAHGVRQRAQLEAPRAPVALHLERALLCRCRNHSHRAQSQNDCLDVCHLF